MQVPVFSRPLKALQSGASLLVAMVMLVVLMLMGVTAVVVSSDQFRMAANLQFQNLAMSGADSALAFAENWTVANFNNAGFVARTSGGLYPGASVSGGAAPDPFTMVWDDSTSTKIDSGGSQRFMVEKIVAGRVLPSNSIGNCNVYGQNAPCPKVNVYRITARGTSILGATKIVQSVFATRSNL